MPSGNELNEFEMKRMWNLRGRDMSLRNISIPIQRSKNTVENALRRGNGGSVKKKTGAKTKLF